MVMFVLEEPLSSVVSETRSWNLRWISLPLLRLLILRLPVSVLPSGRHSLIFLVLKSDSMYHVLSTGTLPNAVVGQ
jgi:hypothetical protein